MVFHMDKIHVGITKSSEVFYYFVSQLHVAKSDWFLTGFLLSRTLIHSAVMYHWLQST